MFDEQPDGDVHGECAEEIHRLKEENERLRSALAISTNGLRHCSRWNISEETEKAIMTQVIANEALLTPGFGGI